MTGVERTLRDALLDLELAGASFALVGGLAVSTRTEPRFTRDVDLAVSVVDDAGAERLIASLCTRGYRVLMQVEQGSVDRLATVRLSPPGDQPGLLVDLLFASSGIESEVVAAAEVLEVVEELRAPVATTAHLAALKVLAAAENRPQDLIDLASLTSSLTTEGLEQVRDALRLIEERGYARNKRLVEEFDRFLARGSR